MFCLNKDQPIYTVTENLQCRQVHLYVKTEFPYHSVLTMISAVLVRKVLLVAANYVHIARYEVSKVQCLKV